LLGAFLVTRAKSYFLAPAYPALLAVVAMPLFPPEVTARVMGAMGPQTVRQERNAVAELPQ
jgi:hypothetical protein